MKNHLNFNWTPFLMQWYDANKRELPWRTESPRDPYKVWVSEIMLQQTRVEAVKSYYTNWMEHFPDIPSLAAAEEEDVVRQWQGLGYYSRARNLHTAVREVMATYGGQVPDTWEDIRKLKGIGDYTAGAILSMAYGKRETAVDGNVLRVFARIYNIEENILSLKTKKKITTLVEARQDVTRPGDFNEALMDLGATVCIPGQPHCEVCPLVGICQAKAEGKENVIPLRITKKNVPVEAITVFIVRKGDSYLLNRRPAKGLLAGMWEFPNCVGEGKEGVETLTALLAGENVILADNVAECKPVKQIRHVFSHKIWQMSVYAVEVRKESGLACLAVAGTDMVKTGKAGVKESVADFPDKKTEESLALLRKNNSDSHWVGVDEFKYYNLAGPHNKILEIIHQ